MTRSSPEKGGAPHPDSARKPQRRRLALAIGSCIIALAVAIFGIAFVPSIRWEHAFSRRIEQLAQLPTQPSVGIKGFPLQQVIAGDLHEVGVRAEDAPHPVLGSATVEVTFRGIDTSFTDLWHGRSQNATAERASARLTVDAATLGAQLGISDLQLQACIDQSPAGGMETCANASGTIHAGATAIPTQVTLQLRAERHRIVLAARDTSAESIRTQTPGSQLSETERVSLAQRFYFELSERDLPLGQPPSRIFIKGGSIYIESETANIILDDSTLASLTRVH